MTRVKAGAIKVLRQHWMTLVGMVAVAGLILAVDPSKVWRALSEADPVSLALMLPCVLLLYVVHGAAWWVALRGAGVPVRPRRALEVMYISQAFVFLPGGDLWRVPLIKSESGDAVDSGAITGTVVFDDLVYFAVLTLGMIPAVARTPQLAVALGLLLLPQAAIFVILMWSRPYVWLSTRVGRMRPFRSFQAQLDLIGPTFRRLVKPQVLIPVVLLDLACGLLALSLFGLGLRAVHAAGVGPREVAFTYAFGQVVASLTVIPAALGAYEGMMTGLIAAQGVPAAVAAVGALLYRAYNDLLMALIGLGVAFVTERGRRRRGALTEAGAIGTASR